MRRTALFGVTENQGFANGSWGSSMYPQIPAFRYVCTRKDAKRRKNKAHGVSRGSQVGMNLAPKGRKSLLLRRNSKNEYGRKVLGQRPPDFRFHEMSARQPAAQAVRGFLGRVYRYHVRIVGVNDRDPRFRGNGVACGLDRTAFRTSS